MPSRPSLPDFTAALPQGPLHYTAAGQGDTVLLIHGSLCDYRYWRWQIPALSAANRVVAPSLRGCWPDAGSHPQAAYAIDAHARDLHALLRALQAPGGAHIIGHSRGAQVAVTLARQAPECCRSLILADPGFRFEDEPESPPFYANTVAQLQAGRHVDEALGEFVDAANGQATWQHMVTWFKDMVRDNAHTLISQIREANKPVSLQTIAAIHGPVLLVGGTDSPRKYRQRLDRLETLLPQARRVRIPLAAHGMNLANPAAFNRAVRSFMADLEPATLVR